MFQIFPKVFSNCPKRVSKFSSSCLKIVSNLYQNCPKVVSKVYQNRLKVSPSCLKVVPKSPKVVSKLSPSCPKVVQSAIFLFWFSLSKETWFLRSGFILTLRWSLYYFEIQQNHFLCITNCNHVAICKQSFEFSSIMLHQILFTHDYQLPRWTESIKPCGRNHSIWQWDWDPMCCYSRTDADIPLESWDSISNFLNILFMLYALCAPLQNWWGRWVFLALKIF